MELRSFKYRLYPSKIQESRLFSVFDICRDLHNQLLRESMLVYKAYKLSWSSGITLNYRAKEIKSLESKYDSVHSQAIQNVCDRLGKSYSNFFRRVREGAKKKGYPRFKSKVHSITYPQSGFGFARDNRLRVSKIGNIPIVKHRDLKGQIKTLTIKRNRAGQWHAYISCEIELPNMKHKSRKKIGIDVGLINFATFSDGTKIGNPRHLQASEDKLKHLQHIFSRKARGSVRKRRLAHKIAKLHQHIADQRSDFHHKLSNMIVNKYKNIVIEKLDIKNMINDNHLSKHIHDAGWGTFARYLTYKAVASGGKVECVDPSMTSKTCNKCGHIQHLSLKDRTFECESCGNIDDRDVNASKNIRARKDKAEYTRRESVSTSCIRRRQAEPMKRGLDAVTQFHN